LGVTIDFELNFNTHIANICEKASRQLNILKRIGKYLAKLGRLTIYYSYIFSNFNYCPVTWHFCSEQNTNKMEKIQFRALKFIYDDTDSTYEELLTKSKLPTLRIRRIRTIAIETFKIVNITSMWSSVQFRHKEGVICLEENLSGFTVIVFGFCFFSW
jgi:hypothetical protein